MANKSWKYRVTYQNPEDIDESPSKRREEYIDVTATSAKRALSKAQALILDEWEGVAPRELVLLDAFRIDKYEEI